MTDMFNKSLLLHERGISKGGIAIDLNWNTISIAKAISTSDAISPLVIMLWFETIMAAITYGFGFLGNLLSFAVFYSQRDFWKVSTGLLFAIMIIFNTIHLWTLCADFLITYNIYLYVNVFLQCRLQLFVLNGSRAVSSYLAMSISIDRFIRSEVPLRANTICTRRNVYKVVVFYLIIFCVFLSFFFCPLNGQNPRTGACATVNVPIYVAFIQNIFFPCRAIITCLIPIAVMSIANIRILYNIRQSRLRVKHQGFTLASTWSSSVANRTDSQSEPTGRRPRTMAALDRALILMTLVNVLTFTVTQIPFHTYTLVRAYVTTTDSNMHVLIRALLLIWSSLYFGIGFYLYCLTTPLFRRKSIKMVKSAYGRLRRVVLCNN